MYGALVVNFCTSVYVLGTLMIRTHAYRNWMGSNDEIITGNSRDIKHGF